MLVMLRIPVKIDGESYKFEPDTNILQGIIMCGIIGGNSFKNSNRVVKGLHSMIKIVVLMVM